LEFARLRDLKDLQNLQSPQKNAHDCTEVCDQIALSKDILRTCHTVKNKHCTQDCHFKVTIKNSKKNVFNINKNHLQLHKSIICLDFQKIFYFKTLF
jgi:hypothetical protein